jgi:hypothetical protein
MGNRLTTFIKNECVNYDRDKCLGAELIYLEPSDHLLFTYTEGERCCIMDGDPCQYFEYAVLPSAKDERHFKQITKLYGKLNPELKPIYTNHCNDCGAEILKKKRYCKICSSRRRKSTFRTSSSKHRKHVNS